MFIHSEDPNKTRVLIFAGLRLSAFDIGGALGALHKSKRVRYGSACGRELAGGVVVDKFKVRPRIRAFAIAVLQAGEFNVLVSTRVNVLDSTSRDVLQMSATGATQRIGRVGQEKRVRVVVLCTRGGEEQS